jgi:hypothetical protein
MASAQVVFAALTDETIFAFTLFKPATSVQTAAVVPRTVTHFGAFEFCAVAVASGKPVSTETRAVAAEAMRRVNTVVRAKAIHAVGAAPVVTAHTIPIIADSVRAAIVWADFIVAGNPGKFWIAFTATAAAGTVNAFAMPTALLGAYLHRAGFSAPSICAHAPLVYTLAISGAAFSVVTRAIFVVVAVIPSPHIVAGATGIHAAKTVATTHL